LLHGDGPKIPDRISVSTFSLGVGLGGSSTTDESSPYSLSGAFAPTLEFPHDRGRIRVLGSFGGDLGSSLDRDPRPQLQVADNGAGGTFPVALQRTAWRMSTGIDLAVRLPYPLTARRPGFLGQLELRYKPLFFLTHERLRLGADEQLRISERVAMAPLNFGFRWHISPRQRFTFYLGPRWDMIGYGAQKGVPVGKPALGPLYSEAWFDLDVSMRSLERARARGKRSAVVGQLTLGYVHSRFGASGMNFGSIVGFLGYMVAQYAIRIRPMGSPVAYQIEFGARIGDGLSPFVRLGVVLPSITPKGGK
ncbi:MAG: hypothetical protein KC431_10115, partial [Myxococcales bacterium]|nr:hypothetical protein [Myxococcales bacterium]